MQTPNNQEITETLTIEQDNIKYLLHVTSIGETISFLLSFTEDSKTKIFIRKLALKEIKDRDSIQIFLPYTCKQFIEFIKCISDMKKISLFKRDNIIFIEFSTEIMLKNHLIDIDLYPEDKNFDCIAKELYRELSLNYQILKQENLDIKKENEELKNRVEILEKSMEEVKKMLNPDFNINRIKIGNKSVIMKENEFDMIHLAIKSRLNKEVKELKKLYQATIDGDGAINFHSRCDNIPNTLVIIKSAGNRRFGGFTSMQWTSHSDGEYKDDPNAFLFSLDKQKIYSYSNNGKAIYNYKDSGPRFGRGTDIGIYNHSIQEKQLWTNESSSSVSYNYNGDKNALSECNGSQIYAAEYEVFQVIF